VKSHREGKVKFSNYNFESENSISLLSSTLPLLMALDFFNMSGIIYIDVQCIVHTNDYFGSFWGTVSKMMARVQLLCAEYVVKYGHSSIQL
jgi:hypothetical protein